MNSKRRNFGWSVAFVASVFLAAWLASDHWSGRASVPTSSQYDAKTSRADRAATAGRSEPDGAADPADSEAIPKVDFTGQWQLDTQASDSMDAIFKAIGMSIIERTMVNNTVVTHNIHQTADEFAIEIKTAFFSRTDHLPLHGEPAQTTDPSGRPVESVSTWSHDGRQLITKVWVPRDQQRFTMTRSLDEGQDRMEVFVEFVPKQGKAMTARRVYRRVNG